jgi:hypothetical protein
MIIENNILTLTLVAKGFSSIKYTSSNNNNSKGISLGTSLATLLSLFQLCCCGIE